jgi:hypothetical protein
MRWFWKVYFWENLRTSFADWKEHQDVINLVLFLVATSAGLGVSIPLADSWAKGVPIFLGTWFGCLVFIITPIRMWKRQKDKLDELEQFGVELVYDDKLVGCKEVVNLYGADGELAETTTTYRVGIRAKGNRTVEKVRVDLEHIDPLDGAFLPQTLSPKGIQPEQQPVIDIDPSDQPTQYVDTVRRSDRRTEIEICYHARQYDGHKLPRNIAGGIYTFTLRVVGRNMQSFERKVKLGLEKDSGFIFILQEEVSGQQRTDK